VAHAGLGRIVELFVVSGARAVGGHVVLAAHTECGAAVELVRSDVEQFGGSIRFLFGSGTAVPSIGAMDWLDAVDPYDTSGGVWRECLGRRERRGGIQYGDVEFGSRRCWRDDNLNLLLMVDSGAAPCRLSGRGDILSRGLISEPK
jgi:hypothetical protein